jgi:ankyrin repeat protein
MGDINKKEYDGYTALIRAALNGHTSIVEILISKGADLHAKTKHDQSALTLALDNNHSRIVELLQGEHRKHSRRSRRG